MTVGRAGQVIGQGDWDILFCTRALSEFNLYRRGGHNLLPLYLVPETDNPQRKLASHQNWHPNLRSAFLKTLSNALCLNQTEQYGLPDGLTPEHIFHYIYGVFHSPCYRNRYAEFLKIDFPRLPLTSSLELFRTLARLGGELVALHLLEAPIVAGITAAFDRSARAWRFEYAKGHKPPTTLRFIGSGDPAVEKVSYADQTVWIDKAKTTGFCGVPEAVWEFHIGGYQVCAKWLKDRKGRTLSADDIGHYHKIVVALHETIRLMVEIDKTIDSHGGWPGAFITDPEKLKGLTSPKT